MGITDNLHISYSLHVSAGYKTNIWDLSWFCSVLFLPGHCAVFFKETKLIGFAGSSRSILVISDEFPEEHLAPIKNLLLSLWLKSAHLSLLPISIKAKPLLSSSSGQGYWVNWCKGRAWCKMTVKALGGRGYFWLRICSSARVPGFIQRHPISE